MKWMAIIFDDHRTRRRGADMTKNTMGSVGMPLRYRVKKNLH